MPPPDGSKEYECRKCLAAGIDPPFRGTPSAIGRHSRADHAGVANEVKAAAAAATAPIVDVPLDGLGPDAEPGGYVREDERVPGGVTITPGEGETKPGVMQRIRRKVWGAVDEIPTTEARQGVPVSGRERKPGRSGRSATAPVFELVWRMAGARLERSNLDPAVGRTLVWQSALAGETIERATKGTWIDRLVQPFAQRADELEVMGALFGLPVMIGYLERNPQQAAVIVPVIADMLEVHLHAMAPVIKKQREKSAKARESARELYPNLPEGADPTAYVLAELFAGTVFETGFGPDELAAYAAMIDEAAAHDPGAAA